MNPLRQTLRTMVRGCYDMQAVRIGIGNRIVGDFKRKLGQEAGKPEKELSKEALKILNTIRDSFRKFTDGRKTFPSYKAFKADGVIDSFTELCLFALYDDLERQERKHFNHLLGVLPSFPVYTQFLEPITGIGPAMAGVLISEIDITRCEYPSSVWAYAGYDVAGDGKGRSRRKEHLVKRKYIDKDGKEKERDSITFNPFLKTKLYVVAGNFLRCGSEYRVHYDNYKHRLEHHENWKEASVGHKHAASMRYMIKRFLSDFYVKWRTLEGLPVAPEYSEAKLGKKHRKAG